MQCATIFFLSSNGKEMEEKRSRFVRCGERGPMAFVSPSTHCVDLLYSMGTGLERQQGALQLERVNVLAPVERGLCANKDQFLKAG